MATSGLVAGINAARLFKEEAAIFPETTWLSEAWLVYITMLTQHFQPWINFGIIKELDGLRIRDKKNEYTERSLQDLAQFMEK